LKNSLIKLICCIDATLVSKQAKIDRKKSTRTHNPLIRAIAEEQYAQVPRRTRYVYFTFLEIYE